MGRRKGGEREKKEVKRWRNSQVVLTQPLNRPAQVRRFSSAGCGRWLIGRSGGPVFVGRPISRASIILVEGDFLIVVVLTGSDKKPNTEKPDPNLSFFVVGAMDGAGGGRGSRITKW